MSRYALHLVLAFVAGVVVTLFGMAYADSNPPALFVTDLEAPPGPALTADHLAAKIAPVLQHKAAEIEPDVVASAGGPLARTAVRLVYPVGVREIPTFTDHGIRAVLDEFGQYSITDLVRLLEDHLATRETEPAKGADRLIRELRSK